MPDVVLRHPKLKGQPIIVHVPLGGTVDPSYKTNGWEIDTKTSPAEAEAENAATAQAAQEKAAKDAEKFTPKFGTVDEPATGGSASNTNTKEG